MNICVITVTYGNRFHLLEKVLDALIQDEIKKIIIIDNGSSVESNQKMQDYAQKSSKNIQITPIGYNAGSAKGFKMGLEKALEIPETETPFFWILDDDNLPQADTLEVLLKFWKELTNTENYRKTALLANRVDRKNFVATLITQNPDDILTRKNSFMGFHWANIWELLYERIMKKDFKNIEKEKYQNLPLFTKISAAPYGGLFFHRDLLKTTALPDEKYVLYCDDFAFTLPITRSGGTIWFIKDSILEDVERSVYLPKKKKWLHHLLFEAKEAQAYYALRNMVYFPLNTQQNTNKFTCFVNKCSLFFMLSIMALLRGELGKLAILWEANNDAVNGKMGVNPKYVL